MLLMVSTSVFCQKQETKIDILSYMLSLEIPFEHQGWERHLNTLTGRAMITLRNIGDAPVSEVPLLLHRLSTVEGIRSKTEGQLDFDQKIGSIEGWETYQVNSVMAHLNQPLPPNGDETIIISYQTGLSGYEESGMYYVKESLDPEFTIIRPESMSYPQIAYPNDASLSSFWRQEKFALTMEITLPKAYKVGIGHKLLEQKDTDEGVLWRYESDGPVGEIIAPISKYDVSTYEGITIYSFPQDSLGAKNVMEQIEKVHELFEDWFGMPASAKAITLTEIPIDYGSQAVLPTIIQTADAFNDPKSIGQLYHEISHIWNAPDKDMPSSCRWNEGLAMFLQYLAYDEINGVSLLDDQLEKRFQRLKRYFKKYPDRKVPIVEYGEKGWTGLSYTSACLVFGLLYKELGKQKFVDLYRGFYQTYASSGASTSDFTAFCISKHARVKNILQDWFYSDRYANIINEHTSFASLVERY